ncbi:12612_t:CDS:1, partial [Cetraspora pellucida]
SESTKKLRDELHQDRNDRLNHLEKYISEYNEFQKQIEKETNLDKLKNKWKSEIEKFNFIKEDKEKLNQIREDKIKELEDKQPGSNDFNCIRDEIHNETKLLSLEPDRIWFRAIRDSKDLTELQRIALNIQHDEKLKTLSNEYYDKISKEIPEIDDADLLNDR